MVAAILSSNTFTYRYATQPAVFVYFIVLYIQMYRQAPSLIHQLPTHPTAFNSPTIFPIPLLTVHSTNRSNSQTTECPTHPVTHFPYQWTSVLPSNTHYHQLCVRWVNILILKLGISRPFAKCRSAVCLYVKQAPSIHANTAIHTSREKIRSFGIVESIVPFP